MESVPTQDIQEEIPVLESVPTQDMSEMSNTLMEHDYCLADLSPNIHFSIHANECFYEFQVNILLLH